MANQVRKRGGRGSGFACSSLETGVSDAELFALERPVLGVHASGVALNDAFEAGVLAAEALVAGVLAEGVLAVWTGGIQFGIKD